MKFNTEKGEGPRCEQGGGGEQAAAGGGQLVPKAVHGVLTMKQGRGFRQGRGEGEHLVEAEESDVVPWMSGLPM